MPLPDLTRPAAGSKFRLLPFHELGFGTTKTQSMVIVDWVVKPGTSEFQPMQLKREETHKKYGIFEKYIWKDGPVSKGGEE
jgi:hypothetical protein